MDPDSRLPAQPTQDLLRGGATNAMVVHATRGVAARMVAVEAVVAEDIASPAHTSALS